MNNVNFDLCWKRFTYRDGKSLLISDQRLFKLDWMVCESEE